MLWAAWFLLSEGYPLWVFCAKVLILFGLRLDFDGKVLILNELICKVFIRDELWGGSLHFVSVQFSVTSFQSSVKCGGPALVAGPSTFSFYFYFTGLGITNGHWLSGLF